MYILYIYTVDKRKCIEYLMEYVARKFFLNKNNRKLGIKYNGLHIPLQFIKKHFVKI